MRETIVTLKPKDPRTEGLTKDDILQRLDSKLRTPGITNIWTQPIRNRIDMLSTGIRTQVGVKVFGADLSTIEKKSAEIERVLHDVPGAVDLYAEKITGAPYLEIQVNRTAAARYGVSVSDAQDVIETAIGGKNLTFTIEGRQRLQIVIPIVLVIIFVLLYMTYHSAKEALHVLLAVPFALTGGIFLLKFLGYNFSVAVWVGFIALFGTAVQTGVVMVIYLEEAVRRKAAPGGALTIAGLHEAVMEGALLRLRPKVMTVATVVAGLLPIMWSTRTGAEVMKPLATPVLGGMVSSLLHVLIVTPVIFTAIRERELRKK